MVDLTPETITTLWQIISLFVGGCSGFAFAFASRGYL